MSIRWTPTDPDPLTLAPDRPSWLAGGAAYGFLINVPATCVIKVPAASVAAYQAAPYWSDRSAYITAI